MLRTGVGKLVGGSVKSPEGNEAVGAKMGASVVGCVVCCTMGLTVGALVGVPLAGAGVADSDAEAWDVEDAAAAAAAVLGANVLGSRDVGVGVLEDSMAGEREGGSWVTVGAGVAGDAVTVVEEKGAFVSGSPF
jgi:hypothetical protein